MNTNSQTIFDFFVVLQQLSPERVFELVFLSTEGGGTVKVDGQFYFGWESFEDFETKIERLKETLKQVEVGINYEDIFKKYYSKLLNDDKSVSYNTISQIVDLIEDYHLTIKTPFEKGEYFFVGATQLGTSGWNGKPDYDEKGYTLAEALHNLVKILPPKEVE
jgi:hypothetical protein